MRAPDFWNRPPDRAGLRASVLSPLGHLYARATARRLAKDPTGWRADVPVICVGNLNAGGTGKTPTVIWVATALRDAGHEPHIVSRGFGGSMEGPVAVHPARHRASQVGDEPLLLSAFAETWVAKDRAAGARAATAAGATCLILDDGFQNPSITKDLSIVVVDARLGFGNGKCIPAGPLREPVATGLARAQALLSIGQPDDQQAFKETWGDRIGLPHATAQLAPLQTGMDWSDTRVFAFAGIGYPEKFFDTLRSLGADLVRCEALDDHQPLTTAMMSRLDAEAMRLGAQLVTTEKDAARLPQSYRNRVITLPVRLTVHEDDMLRRLILDAAPPP